MSLFKKPEDTITPFALMRVFSVLLAAGMGAGQHIAKAMQADSPGGVRITKEEADGILGAALEAGFDKVEEDLGFDLWPVVEGLLAKKKKPLPALPAPEPEPEPAPAPKTRRRKSRAAAIERAVKGE